MALDPLEQSAEASPKQQSGSTGNGIPGCHKAHNPELGSWHDRGDYDWDIAQSVAGKGSAQAPLRVSPRAGLAVSQGTTS
jgi:hypothetical protein